MKQIFIDDKSIDKRTKCFVTILKRKKKKQNKEIYLLQKRVDIPKILLY